MLEQDRTSEQVRCENNRLKEEVEKLNKKITNYEPIEEELKRLVWAVCLCLHSPCFFLDVLDQRNIVYCWRNRCRNKIRFMWSLKVTWNRSGKGTQSCCPSRKS